MNYQKYATSEWGVALKSRVDELRTKTIPSYQALFQPIQLKMLSTKGNIATSFIIFHNGENYYLNAHSQVDYITDTLGGTGLFVLKKDSPVFQTLVVDPNGTIGVGHNRDVDSEAKLLEEINYRLLNKPPENRGADIFMFTEREPCISCEGVVQQFAQIHPYIKLIVYYEKSTSRI